MKMTEAAWSSEKTFKLSPIKSKKLQKSSGPLQLEMKSCQNMLSIKRKRELSLVLDCKARWNSLGDILETFPTLKDAIPKALIDLKFTQ